MSRAHKYFGAKTKALVIKNSYDESVMLMVSETKLIVLRRRIKVIRADVIGQVKMDSRDWFDAVFFRATTTESKMTLAEKWLRFDDGEGGLV